MHTNKYYDISCNVRQKEHAQIIQQKKRNEQKQWI